MSENVIIGYLIIRSVVAKPMLATFTKESAKCTRRIHANTRPLEVKDARHSSHLTRRMKAIVPSILQPHVVQCWMVEPCATLPRKQVRSIKADALATPPLSAVQCWMVEPCATLPRYMTRVRFWSILGLLEYQIGRLRRAHVGRDRFSWVGDLIPDSIVV